MTSSTGHSSGAGGHGAKTVLVLAVGVLAGVTLQALLVQPSRGRAAAPAAAIRGASPEVSETRRPTTVEGVPAGFSRDREGAVSAAAAFVCTGQALLDMDPLAAEGAIRQMAADSAADAQVADTIQRLRQTREVLAEGTGPVVFRQAALAFRIEAWSSTRARVAIWNVGVLSRQGVASPQAGWSVSTFDLVWERGDWKVWGETIAPGPAPILNDSAAPATSAQLVSALDDFTDFGAYR